MIAAGLLEIALARVLPRLRPLFPPEIAGRVVLLTGITTGVVGLRSEEGKRKLAGFVLRRLADRVAVTQKGDRSTVLFHFDH